MHILLDQAVHDHRNKGNNALLAVTYARLSRYWPSAVFDVISDAPHFCRTYLPSATPVAPADLLPHTATELLLPQSARSVLFEFREIAQRWTGLRLSTHQLHMLFSKHGAGDVSAADVDSGVDINDGTHAASPAYAQIGKYDAYIPTGGGYFCDSDKYFLLGVFDRLEAAIRANVPTVMVGQGVGPLTDPELLARAASVLPQIDYLFIREERAARPLLDAIGVPEEKVIMTGDDAIEYAYHRRVAQPGSGIGLSVRVATHTGMNAAHLATIKPIIQEFAATHRAPLVAAPISYYRHESDIAPISAIMAGYGKGDCSWRKFEELDEFIARIGRCRLMISGTCHGAVFALSQGIPVICLARSLEYTNKLAGLSAEFGVQGCEVIALDDPQLGERLSQVMARMWAEADDLSTPLLEQAQRQIGLGYAAYSKIFDLIDPGRARLSTEPGRPHVEVIAA